LIVEISEGRIISPFKQTQVSGKFTLTKPEKKISDPQRKYYFGVLVKEISDYTGYSKDWTHRKLGWLFRQEKSKGTPFVKSLTSLSTTETEEQNEAIRRWAAETLELSIKTPNEIDYSQIKE